MCHENFFHMTMRFFEKSQFSNENQLNPHKLHLTHLDFFILHSILNKYILKIAYIL